MRWITASHLEQWARSVDSQKELAALVSDLAFAAAPDITDLRFPSGDKSRVRGFDGVLTSATGGLFVPPGESIWEIGTEEAYRAKALKDFTKRTDETPPERQRDLTLVLVTAWTWDHPAEKPEDWIAARKLESQWKDVRVLDGSRLETWLDNNPAVAARWARSHFKLAPGDGVRSTDEFWADFSGRYNPRLTEEVLLCDREAEAQKLLETLMQPAPAMLVADSPDEVVAFAIAAMRKAPEEVGEYLQLRTLVVDTADAARMLRPAEPPILFLLGSAAVSPGQFSDRFTTLLPLGRQARNAEASVLPRATSFAMGRAMMSMGLEEGKATTYARGSGRSLAALARLLPGGSQGRPEWVPNAPAMLPSLLAGGWDASNTHDKAALEILSGGRAYAELERDARTNLRDPDPPFDVEGSMWKVRAPMDAFIHFGHLITAEDLDHLKAAMTAVFGQLEPEPDPEAPAIATYRGPTRHSEWLREGLATTLLMIAVWSEAANVQMPGPSGAAFAEEVVEGLPGWGQDYRLLASLSDQLPLLAEAAPRPLLSALERMLEGEGEAIAPIFTGYPGFIGKVYRHTGLLWALETLAWDPDYFPRAMRILARLAALDPGIEIGNRPIKSLREILVLWAPNTNASPAQRDAALDDILRVAPAVGWSLVKRLLPNLHDAASITPKPRLRETGAADRPPVTFEELWSSQDVVIRKAIRLAGRDPERWADLVREFRFFRPPERELALTQLQRTLDQLEGKPRRDLWAALRDEVGTHERFKAAAWAMPAEALAPLKGLIAAFAPDDPIEALLPLFDNWDVDGSGNSEGMRPRRNEALAGLVAAGDADTIAQLGMRTRMPHLVLEALEAATPSPALCQSILDLAFAADPTSMMAGGLSNLYRRASGEAEAVAWLQGRLNGGQATTETAAGALLYWPDGRATWAAVHRFGRAIEDDYWRRRAPVRVTNLSRAELFRSTLLYLRYGRAIEAIQAAMDRLGELPSRLLLRMTDGVLPQLNGRENGAGTMDVFYVEQMFDELDRREDVAPLEIAKREYALYPLFEHGQRKLHIYQIMANDPAFYQGLIQQLFRADGDPKREPSEVEQRLARQAYRLLSQFDLLPGEQGGQVDQGQLTAWIDAVRALGEATQRSKITDQYVGHVLAHAPADPDGAWPIGAVRRELERLASDEVERGMMIERHNMRGAHMRGFLDGGGLERDLAAQYESWAVTAAATPRTAAMLRAIAGSYEEDAKRMDTWAAQRRLQS